MPRLHETCPDPIHHAPGSMVVQSITFDRSFPRKLVVQWLRGHGFKARLEEVGNQFRARQHNPECFRPTTYRVKVIHEGVNLVLAKLKR